MDALSSAASVIALIQLTGALVEICGGYIQEVKKARVEIFTLQQAITSLRHTLQDLLKLLQSDARTALPTSSRLASNITDCLSNLQALEVKLDPGKRGNLMRKVGLRALKWPLKRVEVEGAVQNLERYKTTFLFSLQVDHSSMIVGVAQNTDRMNHIMNFVKLEGAEEAGFESFSDRDEVQCLQGTRTELLQQIMGWAVSPSQKDIFWLEGMAGTGKSTISRTVASLLKDANYLGASFFFKRGEGDRGNAKKFFPSLIRQLMLRITELKPGVQKALDDDPDIASKSLREQFEKLLLQPLLYLDQLSQQSQITVIVIDALDECEHDQDIRSIIRFLPLLQKAKKIHLRIFLTSRPEHPIRLGFSEIAEHEYQGLALHEISEEVTEHDIRLFLQDRFAKIKHERNIAQDWPSDNVIQELVTMSVPLFISAATVCRYIENSKWEPKSRLIELLQDQAKYVSRMDKTYLPILTRLLDDEESDKTEQQRLLQEFQNIVGVIVLLADPLSANALSSLLGIQVDQISNRLDSFRSVLSIPDDRDQPIRTLHLSFRNFLVQSRTEFFVDEPERHQDIARSCFKTMRSRLRRNICNLTSPGIQRADIDVQHIRRILPPELRYSCRYWIYHLRQSRTFSSELEEVRVFLETHFLHWLEAMTLLGLLSEVVTTLDILIKLIPGDSNCATAVFLQDAKRFALKNRQIADEVPLQIYCAGLIFAPQTAIIRTTFKRDFPNWMYHFPKVNEKWSAELQALEGHSGWVESVAFFPDGQLLASGSYDQTVCLWNMATGGLQTILEGHAHPVRSVAFSPNGRLLVSASEDQLVCLWNTATGTLQQIIEGDLGSVRSVAFSPDSRLLATGSSDKKVRLWNMAMNVLQQTLQGHLDSVQSIAFSPDGQLLASGSYDQTVRLWETATGALQQTLEGHTSWVESVAFSPDSRLLASCSCDQTIRVWDTVTWALQHTLEGHTGSVQSVDFSPDGRLLASSSDDETVRLWDTATGALQLTLEGHTRSVRSVAFSPDSWLLVSGSYDQTVRLWDTATGVLQQTSEGHIGSVQTVAFSPNARLLASGSDDQRVCLWDTATGELQNILEGHTRSVRSVVFSPNGRLLASASENGIVCLWDTATGIMQQTLEGHTRSIRSMAFSPDSRLLATGSSDEIVRFWNMATGTLQQTLQGHEGWVESVAFSPDGQLLISGSYDQTVRLWDTATGGLQQTLRGHVGWVQSVVFSPNGRLLASCSYDQTVCLWDTATGGLQHILEGHTRSVRSVAFSPDGQLLASSSNDQCVCLWDTATGELQRTLKLIGIVTELEYSQDGSYLITNLGTLDVQFRHEDHASYPIHRSPRIFLEREQWISLNGQHVLWLPPDCRPSCSAINEDLLVLGLPSGRVSFLRFRV